MKSVCVQKSVSFGVAAVIVSFAPLAVRAGNDSALSAHSYVQKGLVNQWDGIDNQGTGTHDSTASVWKDLSGAIDLTLQAGGTWSESGLNVSNLAASGSAGMTSFKTMEVLYRMTNSAGSVMFWSGSRDHVCRFSSAGTKCLFNATYGSAAYATLEYDADTDCLLATTVDGNYPVDLFVNGAKVDSPAKQAGGWIDGSSSLQIGNTQAGGSYPWYGRVYALRLYNRQLTPRELAYNAAVDFVRYGVAATYPEGYRCNAQTGRLETLVKARVATGSGTLAINDGEASAEPEAWAAVGDPVTIRYTPAINEVAGAWIGVPAEAAVGEDCMTVSFVVGMAPEVQFTVLPRFYAKADATAGGDGLSWKSAMGLADALAALGTSGGELWLQGANFSLSAALSASTFGGPVIIRGGFNATESRAADRPASSRTVIDGGEAFDLLNVASDYSVSVERVDFMRASASAFVKTGAGDLAVRNCDFIGNGRPKASNSNGRGLRITGTADTRVVVSNCVFKGNMREPDGSSNTGIGSGSGIFVQTCERIFVDECQFLTNGGRIGTYFGGVQCGHAMYCKSAPLTLRNSRFAGNIGSVKSDNPYGTRDGGVLRLEADGGGSLIENCTWCGNGEWLSFQASVGDQAPSMGGAVSIYLSRSTDRVEMRNCTIAYNLSNGTKSPGGLNVVRGRVFLKDSIVYGNRTGSASAGADIDVKATGSLEIDHALLTADDVAHVTEAAEGLIDRKDGVRTGDPLFVTSADDYAALLSGTFFVSQPYDDLAAIDVHLLSSAGYWLNDGSVGPATSLKSPAIDRGNVNSAFDREPDPNGSRVNLGAYGNTYQASKSVGGGQPKVDSLAVDFPRGYRQPCITLVTGLASGSGYEATVKIVCTVDDVTVCERTYEEVGSGRTIVYRPDVCIAEGRELVCTVEIEADGELKVTESAAATAHGKDAPWVGKGGGEKVLHVWDQAYDDGDGSNWSGAYNDLATALASVTSDKEEIWLAGSFSVTNEQPVLVAVGGVKVRGGFTATECAPEERPVGLRATIDGCGLQSCLKIVNAASIPVEIERIDITRSLKQAIEKTGAGDLFVSSGTFTYNGRAQSPVDGRAIYANGASAAVLSVSNCIFRSNNCTNGFTSIGSGGAIYAEACVRAFVDDSRFSGNGSSVYGNYCGGYHWGGNYKGCALAAQNTPVTVRRCQFIGNVGSVKTESTDGGAVHLDGSCGGSAFTNCAWIGNGEYRGFQAQTYNYGGGAVVIRLSSKTDEVDFSNCTIARNSTGGTACAGGLTVFKGRVRVTDSIVYDNRAVSSSAGADVDVQANGELVLGRSILTTTNRTGLTSVTADQLDVDWESVRTCDPMLVTTQDDFDELVNGSFFKQDSDEALAALNCHLRGGSGYVDETTGEKVTAYRRKWNSPAIDAGDPAVRCVEPKPNGRRVNLGAYGNTPWATMSKGGTALIVK